MLKYGFVFQIITVFRILLHIVTTTMLLLNYPIVILQKSVFKL